MTARRLLSGAISAIPGFGLLGAAAAGAVGGYAGKALENSLNGRDASKGAASAAFAGAFGNLAGGHFFPAKLKPPKLTLRRGPYGLLDNAFYVNGEAVAGNTFGSGVDAVGNYFGDEAGKNEYGVPRGISPSPAGMCGCQ